MGQDAFMDPFCNTFCDLQCNIYFLLLVPVTKPFVQIEPSSGVVEHVGNMTLTCTVERGTRVAYQWMKNGKPVHASSSYIFSPNNNTLLIVPVMKEDIGNYSCLAANPVSAMESEIITPTIFYGPYGLRVNSDKGLKVGEVFTVDIGEAILFDCSADSNPPNSYSWIRKADNTTHVIKHGPHLEVVSEKVAQTTIDYMCCAYNNVTGKRDETHFTVIITSVGLEKFAQKGKSLSSLAIITGISLFLIVFVSLLFLWKRYRPHRVVQRKLQSRRGSDYRKAQTFSGHENAMDDFGIYDFVALPGPTGGPTVRSQSASGSDFVQGQDLHSTVYEVIQYIPEQQEDQQETVNKCANCRGVFCNIVIGQLRTPLT
ncbi:HEPACAM family member 2 isoform X4 [Carettochelys insculpta]|uniref:HEPACAM family member 2 isoform X4 n=1 Tax=Carettochelys insculpta TaxID=44489 RepID=UPI003EBB6DCB